MSSSILRYGQVIRIRSHEHPNTFITSKSYTDQNVYFQVYNSNEQIATGVKQQLNVPNYRQALFEVLPSSSFEINDEMNSQKSEAKKAESLARSKTEEERFKTMIADKRGNNISFSDKVIFRHLDSQHYLYGSFDCAASGIGAFKIELRKELSEKIVFKLIAYRTYEKEGDEISVLAPFKIYHCETQCYLSYCMERLILDSNDGPIPYDPNISSEQQLVKPPFIKQAVYVEEGSTECQSERLPSSARFLLINQNIPKRFFKLEIHNEFQMKPNRQMIRNHDIVYLIHTKDDKYLCPNNFKKQVFLKKRKGDDLLEIFDGLWEIQEIKMMEEKVEDSRTKSCRVGFSIPRNSYPNITTYGVLMDASKYRTKERRENEVKRVKNREKYLLRHLASGRVLCLDNEDARAQLKDFTNETEFVLLESADSKLQEGTLVQLTGEKQYEDKFIKYYLDVEQLSVKLVGELGKVIEVSDEKQETNSREHEQKEIQSTYEQFFEKENLQLTNKASEHGFRIYKTSEESKQLVLLVMSTQQLLIKFIGLLENYRTIEKLLVDLTVTLLNSVINVLKCAIGFIYDCEYSLIAESGNNPNAKKQRVFDQLGMVELITRMLETINNADSTYEELSVKSSIISRAPLKTMLDKNKNSEYKKVRLVYQLGYEVLESIAANNYLMKIKISKYLQLYLEHILKVPNKVVYRSIEEVLDGNYLALEKKVNEDYIKRLIDSFQIDNPDPADLYFLSRLCICGERTVIKNQNAIFNNFYRRDMDCNEDSVPDNKFWFREDQKKMQILSRISHFPPQYRTLSELYRQCKMQQLEGGIDSSKGHWSYFFQYLNLLADICVHRNAPPLVYVQRKLPLKTLVAFLHDSIVKQKLLFQPFIRLVHHAYVQNKIHEEINRITKVKEWNQLEDFNIPVAKKPVHEELQKTMELIMDYIKRINRLPFSQPPVTEKSLKTMKTIEDQQKQQPQSIDFNPDNKKMLINVKTFLEILKSTLNLGFWPDMSQIKLMIPSMLKVLRFDREYAQKRLEQSRVNSQHQHLNEQQYRQRFYATIKQQLKLNKPNIVMLVQCKILAARILNIIIDYEYNVRVSIITKYFKDVMESNVDLSPYQYDSAGFIKRWKDNSQFLMFAPSNEKEGYLLNEQLWKDKVVDIMEERNLFSECKKENIDPHLVLFEALAYSNQELTNLTLQLIHRLANQRREMLKTFKDIILVAGGHLSKLATRGVQITRSVLLTLTSLTIRQISMDIKMSTIAWSAQSKAMGAIRQLAALTMAMISNKANPTPQEAAKFYGPKQLYPFYDIVEVFGGVTSDGSYLVISEKDENLPLNQSLIKSQDHHLVIMDFIKIMTDLPNNPLPIRALHAAYNFLTVLVWNHSENKKQLQWILKQTECHLVSNVGCIDFYREMYTNNKKLVKKSSIASLVNNIIQNANKQNINLYLKSKLMDFLRILVIFDNKGYDVNQNIVMEIISQYQVSSYNLIVYLWAEELVQESFSHQIQSNYDAWVEVYCTNYAESIRYYSPLNVSAPLFYIATFFEVFSALIENENVVNIGKASNMHPLHFVLKVLARAKTCWPIVRHLRAYINRLYYFKNREKDTILFQQFAQTDLQLIKTELRAIVQLVCNTPEYNMIRIQNPIRYCYIVSYVFLSLQQILFSLHLLFSHDQFSKYISLLLSQQQTPEYALNHILLQIIEMLEYLLKTIDGRYINKYLAKVSRILKAIVANTPFEGVERYMEISKNETTKNINELQMRGDDIPFKKSYVFHQNKGFWRHLIDWNSFKEQELQRERDMSKVQKRQQPNPNESKQAQKQRKRDYLLDVIYLGNIDKKIQKYRAVMPNREIKEAKSEDVNKIQSNLPKNLTTSQSNRFKVKNERFDNSEMKNNVINTRLKKLVKFIQVNQQFTKFSQQQLQNNIYNLFADLDNTSQRRYNHIVIGNTDVILSIVKMNELDQNCIKPEYKIQIVEVLTNYVEREHQIFQREVQEWTIDRKQAVRVRNAQDYLYNCSCASFLLSLIINDLKYSLEMTKAILRFGMVLLIGGNTLVQNEIFKLTSQDSKNILLVQLNELIRGCGDTIATFEGTKEAKGLDAEANYSDTYDFYIDNEKIMTRKFVFLPETVEEQREFDEKVAAMQYAFILLKNLCEGNNQIKNYVREQVNIEEQHSTKSESINFISLGVAQLKRMFTCFNIAILRVPFSIIDFLNEVTQLPCIDNQLFLCHTTYFHDFASLQIAIKQMLESKEIKQQTGPIRTLFHLYSSNINNIISCLEGNVSTIYELLSSDAMCRYYTQVLSFYIEYLPVLQGLNEKITEVSQLSLLLSKTKLHSNNYLMLFQVISVVCKLKSKISTPEFLRRIENYLNKTYMHQFYHFLEGNLLGIQIRMDEYPLVTDRNQTLFFPKHNIFRHLSRATRDIIMEDVDRSTERDKIIGLLQTKQEIIEQITYNYYLDNEFRVFGAKLSVSDPTIERYKNYGLAIATIVCVLMLHFAVVLYYPDYDIVEYDLGPGYELLNALSYLQLGLSFIYLFLWCQPHTHLAVKRYQRSLAREDTNQKQSKWLDLLFKVRYAKEVYCLLNYDGEIGNVLFYMAGSILGTFYRMEWFAILLIDLLMARLDVLKNILKALKTSMSMLQMLALFGVAFIAIFSIFSLHYYAQALYPSVLPTEHCESVADCIMELYIREEIGESMSKFQLGRFLYDTIYVIFMDFLFGNIVGGVLIDNFAELRGKREKMIEDKKGKCFICGIDRQILQKSNKDLKTHYIQQYHKLWNYVFYLYHLGQQRQKTGLEQIIEMKCCNEDVTWIPSAAAENDEIEEKIAQLEKGLQEQRLAVQALESKGKL